MAPRIHSTFLERDLPQLGITIRSTTLMSLLEDAFALSRPGVELLRVRAVFRSRRTQLFATILICCRQRWLCGNQLPWQEKYLKAPVKSPKVYIAYRGLLPYPLRMKTVRSGKASKDRGPGEGFVIEQVVQWMGFRREDCYFYDPCGS